MRKRLFISLIALLAFFSCEKEVTPSPDTSGTGTLHISFDMGASTKAGAKDGDMMKTGSLWLVDDSGKVIVFDTDTPNAASFEKTINNIQRGDYTLYLVANYTGLNNYTVGKDIDEGFTKRLLSTITSGQSPEFNEEVGMPCSCVQQVHIAAGENHISAHLQRCVGRLSINVRNNISSHKLAIGGIGLSDNNPTTGYLFPSADGSIPPSATDVAFPELAQHVVLATNENKDVYDVYLYDTGEAISANGITFTLFGAVYEDQTPDENISISQPKYSFSNNDTNLSNGGEYLIRSAESNVIYIGDLENSGIGVRKFSSDEVLKTYKDIKNFLWRAEVSGNQVKFKNVGTARYITLSETTAGLDSSGTQFYFSDDTGNGALLFSTNRSWSWWSYSYSYGYSLTLNSASNGLSGTTGMESNSRTRWLVRTATSSTGDHIPHFVGSDYDIPWIKRTINYLDKHGKPQDLKSISRNEHVEVSINVFYNREWGQFDFEVEGWKIIDGNETTFD